MIQTPRLEPVSTLMNANLLFLLNLLSTWYLVGLIWMVQIVHYNLFDRVGEAEFIQYETDHNRLITPIVGPPMLIELVTAVALLVSAPTGFPHWAAWMGVITIGILWMTTFFVSVPCHNTLLNGFDPDAYHTLVRTNWVRTLVWTVRGVMMGYFALSLLK